MLTPYLDFESEIKSIDVQIVELRSHAPNEDRIGELRKQRVEKLRELYSELTPWQRTQVARHKDRPHPIDLIHMIVDEFVEMHGDRCFGDDKAIITGLGRIDSHRVMLVGHRKGRTAKERTECNFGSAHPEGYRKALLRMRFAEKYQLPIVCLIDTAGAYPGIAAEERGQSQAIAENLMQMSQLRTPIICVIVGEGGSGGALGIGVGDHVAMFEHAYYSVISPEGCAGILWKDRSYAQQAAESLKFTASELLRFGVIEAIIPEPVGGAHRDPHVAAMRLKFHLQQQLNGLREGAFDELLQRRYERFRSIGEFAETACP